MCVCLSVVASRVEVGFKAASAVCKGPPLSGKRRAIEGCRAFVSDEEVVRW